MKANFKLIPSIEQVSLLRKFSITFFYMSIMPLIVIAFLLQYTDKDVINNSLLCLLLGILGMGIIAGFLSMRKSIIEIQRLAFETAKAVLPKDKDEQKVLKTSESEITQLEKTFREVTANLEDNVKRLETSRRTMQYVLSKLAIGISSLKTLDTFLDLIVEITTNALDAEKGILMLMDYEKNELYIKAATGLTPGYHNIRLQLTEDELPGWVARQRRPLLIPPLLRIASPQSLPLKAPLLCSPMLYKDKLIGVLIVSGRVHAGSFEEDELIIVSNLASQTAVAVENERLNLGAEKTYIETISALAMAVEARDPYSRGHSDRVSLYAVKIAEQMKMPADFIQDIKVAAQLHDVGKIGIGDDVLKKPGPLNEEEWFIMRKHPIIGEGIVQPVTTLAKLCPMIRSHHEWVDGIGYPDGLKSEQIPLGAKILAVSDSFDAMTTDRPYRKALSFDMAKEDLKKYIGIRYEKEIVEAFLQVQL